LGAAIPLDDGMPFLLFVAGYKKMKILFVASEVYPLVKTGGLADVAYALPKALADLGEDVRILLPAYPDAVDRMEARGRRVRLGDPLGTGQCYLLPGRIPDTDVRVWLLDNPAMFERHGDPYLDADGIDWPDNHLRFALLSRVAAMIALAGGMMGWQPDVVHAHDWQTGLVPAYLAQWRGFTPPTLFTIHNLNYQGRFAPEVLESTGLGPEIYTMQGAEFWGSLSYLKAGITYSDKVTTVSPTYAQEILTPEFGGGMEGVLAARADDLVGILNGIDLETWDPATDPLIPAPYSAETLDDKEASKRVLLEYTGLPPDSDAPVLGLVGRLVEQKGVDIILDALPGILDMGFLVIIQGTGDTALEARCIQAMAEAPDQVSARIDYDETFAHLIQAGSDAILVPSRFEPCGLTQLYAMRYGSPPIVRRTGGLADTVIDAADRDEGSGFVFDAVDPAELIETMGRVRQWYGNKAWWRALQKNAMSKDYSWHVGARSYHDLYRSLLPHQGPMTLQ